MNWFLLGVELDADTGINSSNSVTDGSTGEVINGDLSYLATLRGRLGVLWGDVLFYGTGGGAAARYTFTDSLGGSQLHLKGPRLVLRRRHRVDGRVRCCPAHRVSALLARRQRFDLRLPRSRRR